LFSNLIAALTILASLALIVPTAFWVNLRMPKWRGVVEFITLLPFVIPAIVLVFGIIKTFGKPVTVFGVPILPSLLNTELSTNLVLVGAYTVLSLPYMYRATDNGLRAMDVRTLAEAAQSLGANWFTVLTRVIMPNLRTALLSGSRCSPLPSSSASTPLPPFWRAPCLAPTCSSRCATAPTKAAALTIVAFALTWLAMGVIDLLTRGRSGRDAGRGGRAVNHHPSPVNHQDACYGIS
jgi:putative spermidine/putrescine transport system permease protein